MTRVTIQEAYDLALRHHQAGRLPEAESIYRRILDQEPKHAGAIQYLGVIANQVGKSDIAIELLREAVRLNPNDVDALYNLGGILKESGHSAEAIAPWRKVLALKPDHADCYNNLGNALFDLGQLDEAIEAWRGAVVCRPSMAQGYNNLGVGLLEKGDAAGAMDAWRRAIVVNPQYAETHNNLGNVLQEAGRIDEAIEEYRRAIAVRPQYPKALSNLGVSLRKKGQIDEAISLHRRAIAIDANYAEGHLNLALDLLLRGDWEEGWRQREWRWKVKGLDTPRSFSQPRWQGEAIEGKTLFIYDEQGLGDCIQFMRYVPLVAERGAKVVLEVPPELIRIAKTLPGMCCLVETGQTPPPFDLQCPIMGLPMAFGTTPGSIPMSLAYLSADPVKVETWRTRISAAGVSAAGGGKKVGLVWAGNPKHKNDRNRSISLSVLAPLGNVPGVQLYSLQRGDAAAQTAHLPKGLSIIDWSSDLSDFSETAALISQMDLIISVDTAPAHLAGAMGKPVWLLLPFVPDWRWLREGDATAWYPTMRLFRQRAIGDWGGLVGRVAEALFNKDY